MGVFCIGVCVFRIGLRQLEDPDALNATSIGRIYGELQAVPSNRFALFRLMAALAENKSADRIRFVGGHIRADVSLKSSELSAPSTR